MKKKKLKLDELKVVSFVTALEKNETQTINGGYLWDAIKQTSPDLIEGLLDKMTGQILAISDLGLNTLEAAYGIGQILVYGQNPYSDNMMCAHFTSVNAGTIDGACPDE